MTWCSCFEAFHTFKQLLRKALEVAGNLRARDRIVQGLAHHRKNIVKVVAKILFLPIVHQEVGRTKEQVGRPTVGVRPTFAAEVLEQLDKTEFEGCEVDGRGLNIFVHPLR